MKHRAFSAGFAATIVGVAGHRMAQRRQVNANLVRAARVEVTAQKRMGSSPFDDLVARPRESTSRNHRHPFALSRVAADRPFQHARVGLDAAPHDGKVGATQSAVAQLRGQHAMGDIVARGDDESRSALVEPVHDPRPHLASGRRPLPPESEQRVHQGARTVAGRRVDHHPGGLVDDHEVGVRVNDLQRNLLRRGRRSGAAIGRLVLDLVARRDPVRGSRRLAIQAYRTVADQAGRRRSAHLRCVIGQESIQSRPRGRRDQLEGRRTR